MTHPPMVSPMLDPTRIFEIFRGNHGTELLTAAVAKLGYKLVRPEGGQVSQLLGVGVDELPEGVL